MTQQIKPQASKSLAAPRDRQRYRTRKDLIRAAGRLLKEGRKPSLEDVAEAALVSRATIYRYFPNIEALLAEAPVDYAFPDGDSFFTDDPSADPIARLDRAEAENHRVVLENETALRLMLASILGRSAESGRDLPVPLRQNRRGPLIDAALAPVRDRIAADDYDKLRAALALLFGMEAMIVFRDVLQMEPDEARDVKSWALRALVRAALNEAGSRP